MGSMLLTGVCAGQARRDPFAPLREQMVREAIMASGVTDARVLESMRSTPRHEFVPAAQREQAYLDMALPIGEKQTISSPFIVAFMTESLRPQPTDRVLEIGTGSGYQAAVLSPLVKELYSIEIVEPLGRRAARTLKRLEYENVHVKIGDGYQGWPEHAPFDKIIVTCSPEAVPKQLVEQMADGGMMIVPVGERYQQILYRFIKRNGELEKESLRPTLFVPMTGTAEQQREIQPKSDVIDLRNLSFEEPVGDNGHLPAWYYQRQVAQRALIDAPDGKYVAHFENQIAGLGSRLLQGFALNGKTFRQIKISAWIKTTSVTRGPTIDMRPSIAVSFYDGDREPLGQHWLGPWDGTQDWHEVAKTIRVPLAAREAILRIGLFGATGELFVDRVTIQPTRR